MTLGNLNTRLRQDACSLPEDTLVLGLPVPLALVLHRDPGKPILSAGAIALAEDLVGGHTTLEGLALEAVSGTSELPLQRVVNSWNDGPRTLRAEVASRPGVHTVTFIDDTEHVERLAAAQKALSLFERAFDHLPVAAYIDGDAPGPRRTNQRYDAIYGPATVVGADDASKFGPPNVPADGASHDVLIPHSGGKRAARATVTSATTLQGDVAPTGLRCGVIEETHDLQEALHEANEDNARKSRFLASISHELRTPMYGILGMLEMAIEDGEGPARSNAIGTAHECAERLLHLLNDILDLSKIESQEYSLSPRPVDPDRVVGDTVELLREYSRSEGVQVAVVRERARPGAPVASGDVLVDDTRLQQVLSNLLSNAIKFTHRGGHVTVNVDRRLASPHALMESLRIEVIDDGVGIPKDALTTIFSDYMQIATSQEMTAKQGTGLGLAIVKQLVHAMEGECGVESTVGEGSTFWIELALPRQAGPRKAASSGPKRRGKGRAGARLQSSRVLLAEDNPVNQRILSRALERDGHEVTIACTGRDALDELAQHASAYDFVLMDVQMPVMNGLEATRTIRAIEAEGSLGGRDGRIPIIALTASAMPHDEERCVQAGVDGYLSKPLITTQLYAEMLRLAPERAL